MDLEHEKRLTAVEQACKSNGHRLDRLETSTAVLNRLATSMEVMASRQEQMAESVEKLDGKVTAMERKPLKRMDGLLDKIIWAVCAAVISFLLARLGLGG